MTRARAALLTLTLALAACSRNAETETSGASGPGPAAAARAEGAPQIVDSADGVHIEYRVYGRGEPAVVLVHGWACDSNYWSAQLAPLKARFTVVTVDLAGHGASGRNRSEWTMGRYGDDVAAVVRQIAVRDVVLVGHSMGGPVVLEAAQRIGDRVIGIIGVDTFKSIGQPPVPPALVEQRLQAFRADFVGATREFVTQSMFTADADPQLVRKIAADMALAPPEVAIGSIVGLNAMDFDAVLPAIKVPLIAINAAHGGPTDEARIREHAPGFRAVVLEGPGHFLMMEDPERFNAVLIEQIESLTEGARG